MEHVREQSTKRRKESARKQMGSRTPASAVAGNRGTERGKQRNNQTKQTFAVEEQTDTVISWATCSKGFNVKHYFLIKLN